MSYRSLASSTFLADLLMPAATFPCYKEHRWRERFSLSDRFNSDAENIETVEASVQTFLNSILSRLKFFIMPIKGLTSGKNHELNNQFMVLGETFFLCQIFWLSIKQMIFVQTLLKASGKENKIIFKSHFQRIKCFHFFVAQQTALGLRNLLESQWRRMTHFGRTGVYFVSVHFGGALCLLFLSFFFFC